jgi:hypothetical protein
MKLGEPKHNEILNSVNDKIAFLPIRYYITNDIWWLILINISDKVNLPLRRIVNPQIK